MNALNKKIRFGVAAAAIDLTPKAFRNWLQRYDLHLVSDHKTRGWTDFTLGDVAVLAITRELVRWGVGVGYANEIAFTEVRGKMGPLFEYRNTPAAALVSGLSPYVLVSFDHDEHGDPKSVAIPAREIDDLPQEYTSYLLVHLGPVVEAAFRRIGAMDR